MVLRKKLQEIRIFKDFPDEYVDRLAQSMTEKTYEPGQIIFEEGSVGNALYIIGSGSVEIKKVTDQEKNTFKVLALLEKGDYFGEMSLLEDKPRSASAYAVGTTEIFALKREDFNKQLHTSPQIAVDQLLGILKILSDRLRHTSIELTAIYEIGRVISTLSDPKQICLHVIEKLYSSFRDKTDIWIALWNKFNEEYDLIQFKDREFLHGDCLIWSNDHPLIVKSKQKNVGWISNNLLAEGIDFRNEKVLSKVLKLLVFPLKDQQSGFLGFIFASRTDEYNFLNSNLILVSAVGSFTSTALMNASFIQEELQRVRLEQGKATW